MEYKKTLHPLRNLVSILSLLFLLVGSLSAKDFEKEAIQDGTGYSKTGLTLDRLSDLLFIFPDPFCCCNPRILKLFYTDTKDQTDRANRGENIYLKSLTLLKERVDMKTKELKNWKIANGIYSFSDRTQIYKKYTKPTPTVGTPSSGNGCKKLDYNKQEDRDWYQQNIIDKYEAKGNYTQKGYKSNAYGRYQFMPTTGADYCKKASKQLSGVDCCGGSYVMHHGSKKGQTTTGAEWRTGENKEVCQDTMNKLLTTDNFNQLGRKNIPQNSCTMYLSHQLGGGGLAWLMGGKNPYKNVSKVVKDNVGDKHWNDAVANGLDTNDENQLRQMYKKFWDKKFGGDIFEGKNSTPISVGDFVDNSLKFENLRIERDRFWRKGIIQEMFFEIELLENIMRQIGTEEKGSINPS